MTSGAVGQWGSGAVGQRGSGQWGRGQWGSGAGGSWEEEESFISVTDRNRPSLQRCAT